MRELAKIRHFEGSGSNLKSKYFDPQKAHRCVIPRLLSTVRRNPSNSLTSTHASEKNKVIKSHCHSATHAVTVWRPPICDGQPACVEQATITLPCCAVCRHF